MERLEAMSVTLVKPWMHNPVGSVFNLQKWKAEELIQRGYAVADDKPKTRRQPAAKNRAIQPEMVQNR